MTALRSRALKAIGLLRLSREHVIPVLAEEARRDLRDTLVELDQLRHVIAVLDSAEKLSALKKGNRLAWFSADDRESLDSVIASIEKANGRR